MKNRALLMDCHIRELKDFVKKHDLGSKLKVCNERDLKAIKASYPDIPEDFLAVLAHLGWGSYGNDSFMIYNGLLEPSDIFDDETANEMSGYLFLGDDFSGWMFGYDTTCVPWKILLFDHNECLPQGENRPTTISEFIFSELRMYLSD
ncbi:hypothetical protein [Photobacterium sanguinicancri]|uniref:hypothetical protein n=1 Tax=Photobacterium sanguinicancri TaxID=875932 RepID=UPI0026E42086|nr:hypothetical protein [Photobacterium sanguinicancri]MDO6499295.1 hypothetical protein [Photobacterium sanguinicancri]